MTETDRPDIIALPPLILAAALAASTGLEFLAPIGLLPPSFGTAVTVVGVAIVTGAVGLAASAIRTFRAAGTNVEPFKPALALVEHGPYRFTRNPMYVGLVLIQLGVSIMASLDWGLLLTVTLGVVLHHGVILREEAYLTTKFGQPYADYLARTRRWL